MWQAWANGILGLWIAASPFITIDLPSARINNMTVGLIAAVVASYIPKERPWVRFLGVILGIWIFVSGLTPGLSFGSTYVWNNLICGTLIANTAFAPIVWDPVRKQIRRT